MRYKAIWYDEIFQAVYEKFKISPVTIPRSQWVAWHAQVKRLFEAGILIKEILNALDEAAKKNHWPIGTGFWKRVEDIVYLHRKEEKKTVREDTGLQSLKDIFKKG